MIIKSMALGKYKSRSVSQHVSANVNYCAKTKETGGIRPLFTNCAGDDPKEIITEMEAWASLNPNISNPVRQVVFSPEVGDRILTPDEQRAAFEIYKEERGLGDALFAAYLHTDGHKDRHPHHLQVVFIRIKSDGTTVPDSWDSSVHRRASRKIEKALGLKVNAGADEKSKFNGRNRHVQREHAAERRKDPLDRTHVDPDVVARCISASQSVKQLRVLLQKEGIEIRIRSREGQAYAWSLRNVDGPKEWTSGSKLTASNNFGWGKVQAQLALNLSDRQAMKVGRKHPTRMRGLAATRRPQQQTQRLDQLADTGVAEAFENLQNMLGMLSKIKFKTPVTKPPHPQRKKPAQPKRPALRRPKP